MADIELVIKIDKDIAQGIIDGENDAPRNIVRAFQATIADAIKNGTPIPEGATNGDMIKIMFPNAIFTDSRVENYVCNIESHLIGRDTKRMYFDINWWNAPYRKVEE